MRTVYPLIFLAACSSPFTGAELAAPLEAAPLEGSPEAPIVAPDAAAPPLEAAPVSPDAPIAPPEAAPLGVCEADADCGPCPVPSMSPACIHHPKGNWCSCTCDGSPIELAACGVMCAPAAWSDCHTCAGQVLGRGGDCACGKLAPQGCQASTCIQAADCSSGNCAAGWCAP
jgi:hypothetical protein